MDNRYKKLAKNSAWTLLGNIGSKALGFLLLPLYTRWLGTAGFGESDLITTYASFLLCFMTLCIIEAIFVYSKNTCDEKKKSVITSSAIFIVVFLTFWFVLWALLSIVFPIYNLENSFSNNLWLIYGMVVSTAVQQFTQQILLSLEKIKVYSSIGIVLGILTILFSYLLIPIYGVRGYVTSIISANLITSFICFVISKSYRYFSLRSWDKPILKSLLKYSIPLIPNSVMWWLVSTVNRPLMEHYLDYSSIGIYAVANRFPGVVVMIFTVFTVAWNISIFEEFNKEGFEQFYKKTFRMLFLAISIITGVVIFFSKIIIGIIAAPEFHDAWMYMDILLIGAVFQCFSSFMGSSFAVVKKSKYFFYSSVWGAVSAVVLNLILIPNFGIWGAALSVAFSFLIMMLSRYIYSYKYVKVSLMLEIIKYILPLVMIMVLTLKLDSVFLQIIGTIICLIVLVISERDIVKPTYNMVINKIRR